MKTMIMIYLLGKSAWRGRFTLFDIRLTNVLVDMFIVPLSAPAWLRMIANLEQEAILPEAWGMFVEGISDWFTEVME